MAEEVRVLKSLRDNILLNSSLGKRFVEFYHEVSPLVADFISKHDALKAIVQWCLLSSAAMSWTALRIAFAATVALIVLFSALLVIGCVRLFKRKTRDQCRKEWALG